MKGREEHGSMNKRTAFAKKTEIKQQINQLIMTMFIPMVLIIAVLLFMLISINRQYTSALQNANTAAEFNSEFKETIDQEMYNHVIMPRSENSVAELPMDELDNAVSVLHKLEETTTLRDNRWRIQSMINMCENLRTYMIEIAKSDRYDDRMELLDRNIRGETGLTILIETYMHDFIDDEVRELARLKDEINRQMVLIILCSIAGVLVLTILTLLYSVRLSRRITQPIGALVKKAKQLGDGEFSVAPVETDSPELQTLDKGFDEMAGRINALIEKQIKDEKYLHWAELELLQAQINPHFLYNTLDSILILAESNRNEEVVNMVTNLSVFFRNSLSKGADVISLQAERDQVKSYLEIQQIRYSDILQYEIDIDPSLMQYMVPKLILQPLVENALYHGTKNKRALGLIRIEGRDMGKNMLLKVKDNGAGMSPEQLQALQSGVYNDRHTGLGLVNVHKRIKLYCGDEYGLTFESNQGEGTTVSILIPKKETLDHERNGLK